MNAETERWLKTAPKLFELLDTPHGWQFCIESSGAWCWCKPERAVYASPFWEGLAGVPVDECDDNGRIVFTDFIPFTLTGDDRADARNYLDLMRRVLAD